jgi:hypothetical protein
MMDVRKLLNKQQQQQQQATSTNFVAMAPSAFDRTSDITSWQNQR